MADSWPTRRDQPVSVALSPAGDRLALSVGQRLSVSGHHRRPPRRVPAPGGLRAGSRAHLVAGRRQAGVPGRRRPGTGGRPVRTGLRRPEHEARMPALGPASAMAFVPGGDRLAVLAPSLPGRMTLTVIGPDREVIWERALTRKRMSGSHPEGVNLALSPDGQPARLHHRDVGGLGVRYRHRAAGAAIRRSLADRHRPQLDRRRTGGLGLRGRDAAGVAPGRRGVRRPSWRPSRRRGWSSCASGAPR